MANLFQRSNSYFVPFTPTVSPGANAAYPVTNLTSREYPFLPWISTSTAQQVIMLDMLGPVTVSNIAIFHANFLTVSVAHASSTGGTFTNLGTFTLAPYLPEVLPLARGMIVAAFTNRVIRLTIPTQALTTAASGFTLGMVEILSPTQIITFSDNPETFSNITIDAPTFTQRIGGHTESVKAGPRSVGFELGGKWENLVDIKAILATRPDPFILYRNRSVIQEVFFVRCESGRWSEGFPVSDGNVTLSEIK